MCLKLFSVGSGQSNVNGTEHGENIGLDERDKALQRIQENAEEHGNHREEPLSSGPYLAMMKIMHTIHRIMIWPASMLANRRMVRDSGFMKALNTSITGMMGLRKPGTSGAKISL